MLKRWNIIFLFLFLPLQYAIADIHGEIIRIIDGDTVDVLVNKTPIRVRLVALLQIVGGDKLIIPFC